LYLVVSGKENFIEITRKKEAETNQTIINLTGLTEDEVEEI
jgi:hypothetical protein